MGSELVFTDSLVPIPERQPSHLVEARHFASSSSGLEPAPGGVHEVQVLVDVELDSCCPTGRFEWH